MLDAFGGDQRIGQLLHLRGFAANQDGLHAIVVIQVHVHARHDGGVMEVLQVVELVEQKAGMVVVDEGDGPVHFRPGRGRDFIDQLVADEVAESLGTVGIAAPGNQAVELLEQVCINGDSDTREFGHGASCFSVCEKSIRFASRLVVCFEDSCYDSSGPDDSETQVAVVFLAVSSLGMAADGRIAGRVTDPQGKPVAGARVRVTDPREGRSRRRSAAPKGSLNFPLEAGGYQLEATAPNFGEIRRNFRLEEGEALTVDLPFARVAARTDNLTVTADAAQVDLEHPDPGQVVNVREDILDANPGRPGAPVSIPGLPVETASSGIKAPQYFAPGVAAIFMASRSRSSSRSAATSRPTI